MKKNMLIVKIYLAMFIFVSSPKLSLAADNKTSPSSPLTLTQELAKRKQGSKKMDPKIKAEFARAIKELRNSGIEETSKQIGAKAPEFHMGGKPFSETLKNGPVVLKFYRGSWCPYCNLELKAYHQNYSKFKEKGYQLIFLTPDSPREISKTLKKNNYTFPMYTDVENSIAKKFGIAFKLDEKVNELYKKFGINLVRAQDNTNNELPMPGTYIIQKDGTISFAHADADYTNRIDPLDLLKELK